ncbi:hypothetical protein [Prescottella equi]|uniref:hypothetical protein n=1 Tax=Rhodococcus hoagii TaxID=43767 RepID=UPI001EEAB5EA|nr:hypothetical protein [Prescottella equi]
MNLAQTPEGDVASIPAEVIQDAANHLLFVPEPATPDSAAASFWQQVCNAEWSAAFFAGFINAMITIVAAYGIFLAQRGFDRKKEDRERVRAGEAETRQRLETEKIEAARRRRGYAVEYAQALRLFGDAFKDAVDLDADEPRKALQLQEMTLISANADLKRVQIRSERRLATPGALGVVQEFAVCLTQKWLVFFGEAYELGEKYPGSGLGVGLMSLAADDMQVLEELAARFEEWSGEEGSEPDLNEVELPQLRPYRAGAAHSDATRKWKDDRRHELRAELKPKLEHFGVVEDVDGGSDFRAGV